MFVLRSRRTLESRQNMDDDKITMLEEELRKAKAVAIEAERGYEEVRSVCCLWFLSTFLLLLLLWIFSAFVFSFVFATEEIQTYTLNYSAAENKDIFEMQT